MAYKALSPLLRPLSCCFDRSQVVGSIFISLREPLRRTECKAPFIWSWVLETTLSDPYSSLFSYSSAQLSFFLWLPFSHLITMGLCELILISSHHELPQVGQSEYFEENRCYKANQGYPDYVAKGDLCFTFSTKGES